MDAALVASTYVAIGTGQGAPNFVGVSAPVVSSPQPDGASVANAVGSSVAPSSGQITQAVKQINDAFTQGGQNIFASFEFNKATGMEVIKFTDPNTNSIIGQVPSKAVLGIAQALQQSLSSKGLLINIQA